MSLGVHWQDEEEVWDAEKANMMVLHARVAAAVEIFKQVPPNTHTHTPQACTAHTRRRGAAATKTQAGKFGNKRPG